MHTQDMTELVRRRKSQLQEIVSQLASAYAAVATIKAGWPPQAIREMYLAMATAIRQELGT